MKELFQLEILTLQNGFKTKLKRSYFFTFTLKIESPKILLFWSAYWFLDLTYELTFAVGNHYLVRMIKLQKQSLLKDFIIRWICYFCNYNSCSISMCLFYFNLFPANFLAIFFLQIFQVDVWTLLWSFQCNNF